MRDEPCRYETYMADYLKSNFISGNQFNNNHTWLAIKVNISKADTKLAKKIAQDILYQFLDFCNNEPNEKFINDMNKILCADETARLNKQKEEEIRQKELTELKRLKEKYENNI